MKYRLNLQLFDDGGEGGSGGQGGSAGNGNGGQQNSGVSNTGGYSFQQAEEIANARAQRAERAALASFFKQQGMSEQDINEAIAAFKAKKTENQPDVAAITKERDDALAKVADMEQIALLRDKGVKANDLDYVLFKVRALVDDKTDFKKAAESYLKDNPRFTGQGYRVTTGVKDGGSGQTQSANESINNSIRGAFGR